MEMKVGIGALFSYNTLQCGFKELQVVVNFGYLWKQLELLSQIDQFCPQGTQIDITERYNICLSLPHH